MTDTIDAKPEDVVIPLPSLPPWDYSGFFRGEDSLKITYRLGQCLMVETWAGVVCTIPWQWGTGDVVQVETSYDEDVVSIRCHDVWTVVWHYRRKDVAKAYQFGKSLISRKENKEVKEVSEMTEKNPFDYQKPTDDQVERITAIRELCKSLHAALWNKVAVSRERSLALTKLEEVSMWANKAIVFERP